MLDIVATLHKIDALLAFNHYRTTIVVVGGAAFMLQKLVAPNRVTHDIDVLSKLPIELVRILAENQLAGVVNDDVRIFEQTFGPEWPSDLKVLWRGKNLEVKTVSIERLIASRLFTTKKGDDAIKAAQNAVIVRDKFEQVVFEIWEEAVKFGNFYREFLDSQALAEKIYELRGWDYAHSNIKKLYQAKPYGVL